MTTPPPHIEIDGVPAADPALLATLLSGFGHFTAMQVRDGRVRGYGLHVDRLDRSTRELFGPGIDGEHVRGLLAGALRTAGLRDATARVYVFGGDRGGVRLVVTVRAPATAPATAQRLRSVEYWRPAPHIKHLGGFGQAYHAEAAQRDGYDEALLTSRDGEIAEGAVTNIAFWDGTSVIWPSAPCLTGITMALLEPRLESVRRRVTLADLPRMRAAFVTNSRGISPVGGIDAVEFAVDEELMGRVYAAYESVPWESL
ncbi:aminotransferase class IV [Streptomyces sp. P9(2023)]|uniref:aminotransferase class IV n=1 Tax=Streptomyces sp. P9(2023) TaxID=3064394 RepID=UPI0028F3E4AF|nr:aminotransferase class IV [Streptomyces sp. P9(2023)]MDT9690754.1 aminotransferase class IV [Streptomyces sp. P9(2023)]